MPGIPRVGRAGLFDAGRPAVPFSNAVEESTAHQLGVGYIDPIPWFCSTVCTAVIGRFSVYLDGVHINAAWATYLESVLGHAIHLGPGGH